MEWDDPAALAERGREMAGLNFLRALVDGELPAPPVARLLGMRIVEVSWGEATFALTPCESLYNPIGMVHGGVTATLLDSAMGTAVLEPGYPTRAQLLDAIRGVEVESFDRAIDAHVKNVRRKLEPDPRNPRYVLTVHGVGYKFAD